MKKRRKLKKGALVGIILIIAIVIVLVLIMVFSNNNEGNNTVIQGNNKNEVKIKLGSYVITKEEVPLYIKENSSYVEKGSIGKNVVIHLDNREGDYYRVLDLDKEYYVKNDNLANSDNRPVYDDRYKKYIVFNTNVVTEDKTEFYDKDDNLVYTINEGVSLPVIVKENDNKYGVEFANRLMYVKSDKAISNHNTDEHNTSGVAALNYHAFYDENNEQERSECNTAICHSRAQFKSQLDLIKEMDILTLKMKEVEMYIDGKIQLPKSVIITIDDGGRTQVGIDLLTEYQMYATIFMVTSWFDPADYYKTDYIELHSHSHNMHNQGDCPTGQGGGIQCLSEEKIQEDLRIAREKLNNTTYFCYPFYEYNEYSIKMLKQAGFTMSFVGESTRSDNLIKVGSDKFRLPRFVIATVTTESDLRKYFGGMK